MDASETARDVARNSIASKTLIGLISLVMLISIGQSGVAQNKRTTNFLVHAPTQALAEAVARDAERFRDELALYWLGKKLPPWSTPCPIQVVAGPHLAAQGVTTYTRSPVGNFQMKVVGSPERILDSVLPHEVTHTVLATHFGRPLPRWADEGICTTVEHSVERQKHERKLREFLGNRRGIAMNKLFLMTEYPADMLPMYAQGYSVCRFLIQQSGPRKFIAFLEDYMRHPSWTSNVRNHYGYESLAKLQEKWLAWVTNGSGPVESFASTRIKPVRPAAKGGSPRADSTNLVAQSESISQVGSIGPEARQSSKGWYQRRREMTALGKIAANPTGPNPASPAERTSELPYSTSLPQDEYRYGQWQSHGGPSGSGFSGRQQGNPSAIYR